MTKPNPSPSMNDNAGRLAMTAEQRQDVDALRTMALRVDYMIGQITPEEFHWQDANYDRDTALGRELLFLIANNDWVRATSEVVDITRSDTIDTKIDVDVDFNRITHEAFRDRTGQIWLPVVVLPPLGQRLPDPDPFSTLSVTDAAGSPLMVLPHADVRHRVAAALTEIILNVAAARLPEVGGLSFSGTRDHRLLLAAAIYRLLRSEHVPTAVLKREIPARQAAGEPLPRIDRVRKELGDLLTRYSNLLTDTVTPGHDDAFAARQLTERAIRVLRAFAESAVVVVAAERAHTPTVLTVTVPGRALHHLSARLAEAEGRVTAAGRRRARPAAWRWLRPGNWVLPRASLQVDLLLPSADADRQIRINLPDGVSPDPSRPLARRGELDIRTEQPLPLGQLATLTGQLAAASPDWPSPLCQCLAELAAAKADAAWASLRDHRFGASAGHALVTARQATAATRQATAATRTFRDRLDQLAKTLRDISARGQSPDTRSALDGAWDGGAWLDVPVQRRTSTDTVSPGVVAARARVVEDVSQRATPTQARMQVHVAVTDSAYFSTAKLSGWMSSLLMTVVLGFFLAENALGVSAGKVSAEVLALVLTLFSAVQAGRIERPDRSTMRGLLVPAGNPLIIISILPPVVLAVALAFSLTMTWATKWAAGCITAQLLLLLLQWLLLQRALDLGQRRGHDFPPETGPLFYTDTPDYTHGQVLHSNWWRRTTADALMVGRPAYGYVVWQHRAPQNLRSLLHGARPATESMSSRPPGHWLPDWRIARSQQGQPHQPQPDAAPGEPAADSPHLAQPGVSAGRLAQEAEPGISALEQPANVLALLRSGNGAQLLNFAVFRDEPKADWDSEPEDIVMVDLEPGRLAPAEDATGRIGVFLGFRPGNGLPVREHPVTEVLKAAAAHGLMVWEVQLPAPPPSTTYADLQWARVQLSLGNDDLQRLVPFLDDIQSLTTIASGQSQPAAPHASHLVVGVQTRSEGISRILNPRPGPASAHIGPGHIKLVLTTDLDIVAASGSHDDEKATASTWRSMAICADWRNGVESEILRSLDPEMNLAGLTAAVLHGKAVLLLLGHCPGGPGGHDEPQLATPGSQDAGRPTVYFDRWQSRRALGTTPRHPLLRVHMRTPDRPGATLEVLESLRAALQEMAPGMLRAHDWNVWYAKAVVKDGNIAQVQLTIALPVDPDSGQFASKPVSRWGPAEFARIERRALALAARKTAAAWYAAGRPDPGLDTPSDTVIRVGLVSMPDLDPSPTASTAR